MSLASRLAVVVALAVLPSVGLTAYNTHRWREVVSEQSRAEALSTAHLVSAELQQFVEGSGRLMQAMINYPSATGDEQACTAQFKRVISELQIYREFALIDREGKFHCSTVPIPPNLDVRDRFYFSEPFRTGRLTVGTLTRGRVTGESSIHITMPLSKPESGFDGIGALILNPSKLAAKFETRTWAPGRRVVVLDRTGAAILRVPASEAANDEGAVGRVFRQVSQKEAGTMEVRSDSGKSEVVGYVPLEMRPEGLFVAVITDQTATSQRGDALLTESSLASLAVMFLAIAGTWLAATLLIRRPVQSITEAARRREAGEASASFPELRQASELGQLSNALRSMSESVDQLLQQKDFLLRELHHRVMNSLNILTSLLALQSKHARDPQVSSELNSAQKRIMAMANAYKFLYRTDTSGDVDLAHFLDAVCRDGVGAYSGNRHVDLALELDHEHVPVSQATSLAVLIHELITNTFKHAYTESEPVAISLKLRAVGTDQIELRYADRGKGLPPEFAAAGSQSLGLKVVSAITRQYRGTMSINRVEPGTEFVFVIARAQSGS